MYQVPDQTDRTVVVTGANSGTGKEATARLAAAGARVVMAVRNTEKGDAARAEILAEHPGVELLVRELDTADLGSVRRFADAIVAEKLPVDALLNNAGVMAPPERMTTVDGFELQMGTNYFGAFALTMALLPTLVASPAPRVVMMSSNGARMGRIDLDDLNWENRRYRPFGAYGDSKLADLMMGRHLARISRERGWNLLSATAHPGHTETNLATAGASLGRDTTRSSLGFMARFMPTQQVAQGAEPMLFAAADPAAVGGEYYGPTGRMQMVGETGPVAPPRRALDDDMAARLWARTEQITGVGLPA